MEIVFNAKTFGDENNTAITEECISYYTTVIDMYINKLSTLNIILNLESLNTIVITENYMEEVFSFQKQYGLSKGCTDNEMGIAHAQVISFEENGEVKYTIYISKMLIFSLLDDNKINAISLDSKEVKNLRQLAINLLHHELIHVHDFNNLKEFYLDARSEGLNCLQIKLIEISSVLWSEYYACRESCCTHIIDENEILNLVKQFNFFKTKMQDEISSYRIHGNINELIGILYTYSDTLFKTTSYLLGNIYSLVEEDAIINIKNQIAELLKEPFFIDVWNRLFLHLNYLYSIYPNWKNTSVFDELGSIIILFYNNLGFFPHATEQGIYYSIPL